MLEKYEFLGAKQGKHLLILAAIHGNEQSGTRALKRLITELDNKRIDLVAGKLTLVPICNPEAYKKDIRQIDENLNRVIKQHQNPQTYEQHLANEICPLIKDCDVMLDLHSTHCEGDVPFAFCDYPNADNQKLISVLPVYYVLEGWPNIYATHNEIEDFSTERTAHDYGKTGTTLECGYHKCSQAEEIAYHAVLNALSVFEMIDNIHPQKLQQKHILLKSYVVKKSEGKLLKNYKHLDEILKGEEIACYDNGEILSAPEDGYILLPNLRAEIGAEWYYLGI